MIQQDSMQALHDSAKALSPDTLEELHSILKLKSIIKLDTLAADTTNLFDSIKVIVHTTAPRGFVGIPHPSIPQTESWVFIALVVLFFLLSYTISQSSGFISDIIKTFFQVKERSSIFSKATVNDSRFRFFLILFSTGVLSLYAYLVINKSIGYSSFKEYGCFLGITGLFFILKSLIFDLIGYVFLSPLNLKMAKDSYFNIVSVLGIALFPLLILQIYIPGNYGYIIEIISLIICFFACILVIIKLFQIFFRKIVASFYILLYLCTLEFLPLIVLYLVYQFVLKSV